MRPHDDHRDRARAARGTLGVSKERFDSSKDGFEASKDGFQSPQNGFQAPKDAASAPKENIVAPNQRPAASPLMRTAPPALRLAADAGEHSTSLSASGASAVFDHEAKESPTRAPRYGAGKSSSGARSRSGRVILRREEKDVAALPAAQEQRLRRWFAGANEAGTVSARHLEAPGVPLAPEHRRCLVDMLGTALCDCEQLLERAAQAKALTDMLADSVSGDAISAAERESERSSTQSSRASAPSSRASAPSSRANVQSSHSNSRSSRTDAQSHRSSVQSHRSSAQSSQRHEQAVLLSPVSARQDTEEEAYSTDDFHSDLNNTPAGDRSAESGAWGMGLTSPKAGAREDVLPFDHGDSLDDQVLMATKKNITPKSTSPVFKHAPTAALEVSDDEYNSDFEGSDIETFDLA